MEKGVEPPPAATVATLGFLRDLVAGVGFPIAVALYLLSQTTPRLDAIILELEKNRESINIVSAACSPRITRGDF